MVLIIRKKNDFNTIWTHRWEISNDLTFQISVYSEDLSLYVPLAYKRAHIVRRHKSELDLRSSKSF